MCKTRQLQLGDNSDQGQQIAWEDESLSSPSWKRKTSARPIGKMSDLPMIFIVRLSVPLSVWADLSFQERHCKIAAPITECLCHKRKGKVTANGAEQNLHVLMVTLLRNALMDKDKCKLGREDLRVERIHQGDDRKAAHHGNQ